MKTAIRMLIEFANEQFISDPFTKEDHIRNAAIQLLVEKAHDLEPVNEQQIKDAYEKGVKNLMSAVSKHQYFNQTFEK